MLYSYPAILTRGGTPKTLNKLVMNIPYYQKNRNQAVKMLKLGKPVWANSWSTDCDGCSSEGSTEVFSVQQIIDIEKGFESAAEWADGPIGMCYVFTEAERLSSYTGGSWGGY